MISHTGIGDLSTSLSLSTHDRGHVNRIGSRPAEEFARPTFAAGAVLWRKKKGKKNGAPTGEIEVALIHRPRYDDWSLAKGKVDPGENLAGTAIREIEEETGFKASLGWLLGYVHYPVGNRTKVVYYWTAEVTDGEFVANEEADELRWLSPAKAANLCSYDIDKDVLAAGVQMIELGCDRRVLYVRHAKAHDRKGWEGDDNLRPLNKKGRRQAEMLVSELSAYRPEAIVSALPDRCQHTATPLSQDVGLKITVEENIGDAGWELSPDIALNAFAKATQSAPVTAIVAQGSVIPGVLARLAGRNGIDIEDMRVKKSSVWVLHFKGEELLGVDYLASPLAVK
ncbi:MAG TPA: NUDIX hydrolase [Candidatus Corynebacterium gallistercoris]|uniref:NUDIX hydrolase n=1 Tax=Candidatus Corynebacterium gallistercoris TaxID=2838530 RepID=A0A9D1RZF6_9CORY|nr:NUDIX hydrolase [Candidatus Corynebacterium gallistercoris]